MLVNPTLTTRLLVTLTAAALVALALSSSALALDHVVLTTHDVSLKKAAKLPPCKQGQGSSKRHPCRQGPPDAGWKFSFQLSAKGDGTWPLAITLRRTTGNVMEAHSYSFTLTSAAVTVSPDLSSLTLNSGRQLGKFGLLQLTFSHPGMPSAATPTPGCTGGHWQTRRGRLVGKIRFVADGRYFGTILESSLPADVSANTGAATSCSTPPLPPCVHGSSLSSTLGTHGPVIYVSNSSTARGTMLFEFLSMKSGPASIAHVLTESKLPASDFSLSSDLSKGSASTSGASRFTGSLSFTASGAATKGPYLACGASATFSLAKGTTTGGISGHFLAIPAPAPVLGQSFLSKN